MRIRRRDFIKASAAAGALIAAGCGTKTNVLNKASRR